MRPHSDTAAAPPIAKNLTHNEDSNRHQHCRSPISPAVICVLLTLFSVGLFVSTFILIVIHNALFFILLLCISTLIAAFLLWNSPIATVLFFLHSFSDSDLSVAAHGQLVKITGLVSCGNVSFESSYEKVAQCVYTSTLLYEFGELCLKPSNVRDSCLLWRLAYSERLSSDFYITDLKSGIRAHVKAGPGCKVIPLIFESRLVKTNRNCRILSCNLRKWLRDRNLSAEARVLRLEEGYIKEGSTVTVMGILNRNNDIPMIVQPNEIFSTGCLWPKLLLPVDVDGLIIGIPKQTRAVTND